MAFRSVPRPSSPPGAKASTECPSHTQSQTPVIRRQTNHPSTVAKRQTHDPLNANNRAPSSLSLSTHTPLTTLAIPGRTTLEPAHARPRSLPVRQSPIRRGTKPRSSPPIPLARDRRPTELSYAPRSAPEPDSQHKRTSHRDRTSQPASTHPDATRPYQPTPRSRGQDKHRRSRIHPIGYAQHAADSARPTMPIWRLSDSNR